MENIVTDEKLLLFLALFLNSKLKLSHNTPLKVRRLETSGIYLFSYVMSLAPNVVRVK